MRAGQLRHRVTIQTMNSTSDGMGGFAVSWTNSKTVYAAIWPLSGKERLVAQQVGSETNYRIRIRYTENVTPANRLKLGDTTTYFDIQQVINPDLKNVYLEMMCRESV